MLFGCNRSGCDHGWVSCSRGAREHADVIMAASHAVAVHLNMVEAWSLFGPWM